MNRIYKIVHPKYLAGRLAVSFILVTAIQLLIIGAVVYNGVDQFIEDQLGPRALAVSIAASHIPEISKILERGSDPERRIQNLAEDIRRRTNAEFVVIGDRNGIRYSHPKHENIGKKMSGGDNDSAILEGRSYISKAHGTLGYSIRGKVPVFNEGGEIVGVVSTGFLLADIAGYAHRYQRPVIQL